MILSLKEAAEYLGCGVNHAAWLFSTGQNKAGKVANSWKVTKEALHEFVNDGGETMTKTAMERRRKPGRPKKEVIL